MHAVNATGGAFLSRTSLRGRYVVRTAIGDVRTEQALEDPDSPRARAVRDRGEHGVPGSPDLGHEGTRWRRLRGAGPDGSRDAAPSSRRRAALVCARRASRPEARVTAGPG